MVDRNGGWHAYQGFQDVPHFRAVLRKAEADPVDAEQKTKETVALPTNLNQEKLSEAALAILGLTAFRDRHVVRAWKGMDWDLLDVLYQKGWIDDPKGKAKSVVLTDEGARLAGDLLQRHFGA
jgi:hypothetical protein